VWGWVVLGSGVGVAAGCEVVLGYQVHTQCVSPAAAVKGCAAVACYRASKFPPACLITCMAVATRACSRFALTWLQLSRFIPGLIPVLWCSSPPAGTLHCSVPQGDVR